MIFEATLFAIAGLGLEVVGTAILDCSKDGERQLKGYSSVWYVPFYAVAPLLLFHNLHASLFALPFYVRGPLYALIFWLVEYPGMWVLRVILGKSPSETSYYQSPWNVHGLIRLDFGPGLVLLGFALEWIYRNLHSL